MKRRTKIVCTLGPATATAAKVQQLAGAGMNVARLNCSHGNWETRRQLADWVRASSTEVAPIGLLVDLQGPKFRIGLLPPEGVRVDLNKTITIGPKEGSTIPLAADEVWDAMDKGDRILLGDGEVELKVTSRKNDQCTVKVISSGIIHSRKGITLVGKSFDVPALGDKDIADIDEAIAVGADFIALSYVRHALDMKELRRRIQKKAPNIRLVAKIETREALKEIDSIIAESDVIMVARGDLGLQMDIEDVPAAQKMIIYKCSLAGKPVITATQMLESMVKVARPTRAEASDVANAILDGTDAVMLSGETAAGDYPIQAVKVMDRISVKTEKIMEFDQGLAIQHRSMAQEKSTEEVAKAAVSLADAIKAKAIVTTSTSGLTPRLVSKHRPKKMRPRSHTSVTNSNGAASLRVEKRS
jgi:pyruvate kinase